MHAVEVVAILTLIQGLTEITSLFPFSQSRRIFRGDSLGTLSYNLPSCWNSNQRQLYQQKGPNSLTCSPITMRRPEPGESGGREIYLCRVRQAQKKGAHGWSALCCWQAAVSILLKHKWDGFCVLCMLMILLTALGLVLEIKIMHGGCFG